MADKWKQKVQVPSDSEPDKYYTVSIDHDNNYGCSCRRWIFHRDKLPNGECKHIEHAKKLDLFGTLKLPTNPTSNKPQVVLANMRTPKYRLSDNKLLIPLVPFSNEGVKMELTIWYTLLEYGYSVEEVKEIRKHAHDVLKMFSVREIIEYVERNGKCVYSE